MKRILAIGIILLFIGMSISSSTGFNTTQQFIKPVNGKTLYVGGSGPGNYTRIQDAIDNASDGDTVFVYDESSPYYENLVIDKSINLIGENRNSTVIDGGSSDNVIQICVGRVTIKGFTVKNSGDGNWENSGVEVGQDCAYVILYDNIIRENELGIFLFCTWYCNITNNIITDNLFGIFCCGGRMIGWGDSNTFSENVISNNKYGIFCGGELFRCTFSNNIITKNIYGMRVEYMSYFHNCTYNTFSHNVIGFGSVYVGTNVSNNNFIKNLRHAKQYTRAFGGFVDYGTPNCKFNGNYWGRARNYPYPIPVRHEIFILVLPGKPLWDMNPAQEPYDIEV